MFCKILNCIRQLGSPGAKGAMPPKFLENMVILCFERRFSKQNSVIHLKSSILSWLRHCLHTSIINNFMIYQDQFETNLLQLFAHT